MTEVRICIPWTPDNGHRDRLWEYCQRRWLELDLGWPIICGTSTGVPLNRSRARNTAAGGLWDVAVFADADNLPATADQVRVAVDQAARCNCQVYAHDLRLGLDEESTAAVLAGDDLPTSATEMDYNTFSGIWAINRQTWDTVGGFDERFTGWGFEDICFMLAVETLAAPKQRVKGTLYHLWHPRDHAQQEGSPTYPGNESLWRRYLNAYGQRDQMRQLLDERTED